MRSLVHETKLKAAYRVMNEIASDTIRVDRCGMNNRHPLVRGFEPHDFRFWFDGTADYVTPILLSGKGVICIAQSQLAGLPS